jgi:choline dehydrogenase-like flavoprotein
MLRLSPAEDAALFNKNIFGMAVILMNEKSRGTVTLTSSDPMEKPAVNSNFLEDPMDMLVLSESANLRTK